MKFEKGDVVYCESEDRLMVIAEQYLFGVGCVINYNSKTPIDKMYSNMCGLNKNVALMSTADLTLISKSDFA